MEEVLYDQPTGRLALVFELMDANLYELIRGRRQYLSALLVRTYMQQLLVALDHMHKKGIFHRDIKPENILIDRRGEIGTGLKLADFGSCRGIYSKQPHTEYISTRWYRAPECLLTDGYYGPEMDIWGAGCVFFEITSLYPLFPGANELDQIDRIHHVLGTPEPSLLRWFRQRGMAHGAFDFAPREGVGIRHLVCHATSSCVDLMTKMLIQDPMERISARGALDHTYLKHKGGKFYTGDDFERKSNDLAGLNSISNSKQVLPPIARKTMLPSTNGRASRVNHATRQWIQGTCNLRKARSNIVISTQGGLPPLSVGNNNRILPLDSVSQEKRHVKKGAAQRVVCYKPKLTYFGSQKSQTRNHRSEENSKLQVAVESERSTVL